MLQRKPLWKSLTVRGMVVYAIAAKVVPILWPKYAPIVQALGEAAGVILTTAGARRALGELLHASRIR